MKRRREGEWERCSEGVKKKVRTRKIKYGREEEKKRTREQDMLQDSKRAMMQECKRAIKL